MEYSMGGISFCCTVLITKAKKNTVLEIHFKITYAFSKNAIYNDKQKPERIKYIREEHVKKLF